MKSRRISLVLLALAVLAGCARGQNYVFGPNVPVSDIQPPGSAYASTYSMGQHSIAVRGETVYVAWNDDRTGSAHIYFARSTDGGRGFQPSINVDRAPDRAWNVSLAVDDRGGVHLCWAQINAAGGQFIYYARSTDGGRTFRPPIRGCDSVSSSQYGFPSIAVSRDGRRIYVVRDDYNYHPFHLSQIFLARSTDGGATFIKPDIRVNTDTTRTLRYPSIAVFDDSVLIVAYGCGRVWVARSRSGGVSFEREAVVCESAGGFPKTAIGVDARGRVLVSWDSGLQPEVLAVSDDTGGSFSPPRLIPRTRGWANPSLSVLPDGRSYLAIDFWNGFGGDYDVVRLIYSPIGGDTWFAPVDPSDGPVDSWENCPTLTASPDGRVFMAWRDRRNDIGGLGYDIYLGMGTFSGIEEASRNPPAGLDILVGPNPVRERLRVSIRSKAASRAWLIIHDATGRRLREMELRPDAQGLCSGTWDCLGSGGARVPSGVYFLRVETPEGATNREIRVIR